MLDGREVHSYKAIPSLHGDVKIENLWNLGYEQYELVSILRAFAQTPWKFVCWWEHSLQTFNGGSNNSEESISQVPQWKYPGQDLNEMRMKL